jgi:hypothetical protein
VGIHRRVRALHGHHERPAWNRVHVIATVAGGFVTFWLKLPLFISLPGGSLVLLGSGLFVGRHWSEWARGRYDTNNSWNARNNYRTK